MKNLLACCACLFVGLGGAYAQRFTKADSLRGALRPERTCYDVRFYDLNVQVDFIGQSIKGYNRIVYDTKIGFNVLQVDLFSNMQIDSIIHKGKPVQYYRQFDAVFVDLGEMQEAGVQDAITVHYQGKPRVAVNAPWDGGFTWSKDDQNKHWLGVSCEGLGASVWWPNKDHLSDEPDSMRITCTVPKDLMCVANGVLRNVQKQKKTTTYEWFVSYPINNYNVTLNVANYVHFSDTFVSTIDSQKLALDYYVLPYNLEKAKKQFKETATTLRVMEKYLDKYPFWNDGFALVETPYLGMEHQSAVAYGNRFQKGYMGRYYERMSFDYIIMHEAAHEWWGNSISCRDHAELWIHETFTTYMEAVYVEEVYSYEEAVRYLQYHANYIANSQPMIGAKDVNYNEHNTDIYYKGSVMLHTLRNSINNDSLWWDMLKTFYQQNKISNVVTEQYIQFVNEKTGFDYTPFFQQYLFKSQRPTLQVKAKQKGADAEIQLRFRAEVADLRFNIGLTHKKDSYSTTVSTKEWATVTVPNAKLSDVFIKYGLYGIDKAN